MDPEVIDEVLALKSIFCNPGEFSLLSPINLEDLFTSKERISFKLNVTCGVDHDEKPATSFPVGLTVVLPTEYPNSQPQFSLSSVEIPRMMLTSLRDKMIEYTNNLHCSGNSGPIIMDLSMWLQQNAQFYLKQSASVKVTDQVVAVERVLLLQLDHMRNKTRYVRSLSCWADEFKLRGRIFFAHHFIFILLVGESDKIKQYLRRYKSFNVDVDSSGKPCKEKMMKILAQGKAQLNLRLNGFGKTECKSLPELEEQFAEIDLATFYQAHIRPLLQI